MLNRFLIKLTAVLFLGIAAQSVMAGQVIYTFKGSVTGLDENGIFVAPGARLDGLSFVATYTWNPAVAPYQFAQTLSGGVVIGGTSYSTAPIIIASLNINEHAYEIGGGSGWIYRQNGLGLGSNNRLQESIGALSYGSTTENGGLEFIETVVLSNFNFFKDADLISPLAEITDFISIYPSSFYIGIPNLITQNTLVSSGFLNLESISVSANGTIVVAPPALAVPEPKSWVMLFSGFWMIGAALRQKSNSSGYSGDTILI